MSRSLKVLQLGKFYPVRGGVEKVMMDLTTGLSQQGVECDMLCAACEGDSRSIPLNPKANVLACKTAKKLYGTMLSPSMITRLRKVCRDYDVIHVHHPDPMAALALKLSGYKGPVVLHWHSDIVKQKKLLKLFLPLQNWLLKRASLIIGTTPVYTRESPYLQKVQDKIVTLPIGVDPVKPDEAAVAQIKAAYPGKKIVFALGRLVPYKGMQHLVEAAEMLPDDYMVLIGGQGPLRKQLQETIDSRKFGHKVTLLGYVPDQKVNAYFGACDVFCLPSVQKTEAFGIVQIEAMSCGKPVVATRIPGSGVSWVNHHGVSGLNVDIESPRQLSQAIQFITSDEKTYKSFSTNAFNRYHTYFTRQQMINTCLEFYNNIL